MSKLITYTPLQQVQPVNQSMHLTIMQEVGSYLQHVNDTKSGSTLKTYTANINAFIDWLLVQDTNMLLKWHLEAYRYHLNSKFNSSRSKNLAISTVRSLFKWLHDEGMIDHNPALTLDNFKVNNERHAKSGLNKYQLHDLMQYTKTLKVRDRVLMSLLLSNGVRANEVSNILIEDVSQRGENMVIYLLRKGYDDKSEFTILNEETYARVKELIGDRSKGYLFVSQKGGGMATTTLSRLVKKIFRAVGIDDSSLTMHSCRHTAAILALKSGANIMQVSQMLGHKHLSSTNVYLKSMDREDNPAEKMFSIYD